MGVGRVIATALIIAGAALFVAGRLLSGWTTTSGGTSKSAHLREVMLLLGIALMVVAVGLYFATE